MHTIADARRYTELLEDDTPESVYDYATLFPEGGFLARGRAKKGHYPKK